MKVQDENQMNERSKGYSNKRQSKVLIVSHSMFGKVLTNVGNDGGIHLKNCEMLPIDQYISKN